MPATTSPYFNVKYGWTTGESGWGDPVNDNFKALSFLAKGSVDNVVASLPISPSVGDSYILSTDNQMYVRFIDGWFFIQPEEGMQIYATIPSQSYIFTSAVWTPLPNAVTLTALAADTGSNLVGHRNTASGAVQTTVKGKLDTTVYIDTDFGAIGDGVADDTLKIQAAINSGAKFITCIAGKTYKITNTLTVDTNSIELDFKNSTLFLDDATGLKSHIKLGNGTTQRGGIKVKNIVFSRNQAATGGYAIDSDLIGVSEISGCRIFGNNRIFRGIRIYRGIIINILNNYIDNCVNRGLHLSGSGLGSNRTVDVTISGNRVEGGVTAMETSDFVEGLYCRNNIFFNTSGIGVVLDATTNANGLASFKLQQNDFDTHVGGGLYIDKISSIQVTGNWFSNNASADLSLKEFSDGVVVLGNQFYPNTNAVSCFGNSARITGNLVSGGTSNILINAAATRTSVSGNTLSNAVSGVDLTTANNSFITGNDIFGMSSSPINNTGGTGVVITQNKGDTSITTGGITVTASPFVYTAGARPQYVSITGGTVSNVSLNGSTIATTTNSGVMLAPGNQLTVTYSVLPTMVRNVVY